MTGYSHAHGGDSQQNCFSRWLNNLLHIGYELK